MMEGVEWGQKRHSSITTDFPIGSSTTSCSGNLVAFDHQGFVKVKSTMVVDIHSKDC
jgi:hypothetical protein